MLMHIQVLQQFLITTALGEKKIFKSIYAITADDPSKPSFCGKFRDVMNEVLLGDAVLMLCAIT